MLHELNLSREGVRLHACACLTDLVMCLRFPLELQNWLAACACVQSQLRTALPLSEPASPLCVCASVASHVCADVYACHAGGDILDWCRQKVTISEILQFKRDGRQLKGPREYVRANYSRKDTRLKAQRVDGFVKLCEAALIIRTGKLEGIPELREKLDKIVEECGALTPKVQQGLVVLRRDQDVEKGMLQSALHRSKAWPSALVDADADQQRFSLDEPMNCNSCGTWEEKLKLMSETYFDMFMCHALQDGQDKVELVKSLTRCMQAELAEDDIFALDHEASQARSTVEDVMDAVSALADMRFEEHPCQAVDMMWKMRNQRAQIQHHWWLFHCSTTPIGKNSSRIGKSSRVCMTSLETSCVLASANCQGSMWMRWEPETHRTAYFPCWTPTRQ